VPFLFSNKIEQIKSIKYDIRKTRLYNFIEIYDTNIAERKKTNYEKEHLSLCDESGSDFEHLGSVSPTQYEK
jgi:hypothetical protein